MFYEAQMQIDPDTNSLTFDKDRLSYQILLGIKLMHNNSAVFYTGVLSTTLKDDYAIDIVHQNVQLTPKDEYDRDIKMLMTSMKTGKTSIPFADIEVLDHDGYESLKDADELTDKNIAEMKLFVYTKNIYGIMEDKIDEKFYKKYVAPPTAYEQYCRNKRFRLAASNDLTDNKRIFAKKMDALMTRQDYNLDMYKKLMSTHHKLLVTGQTVLQTVLTDVECQEVYTNQRVVIQEAHVAEVLQDFIAQLKKGKYGVAKELEFYSLFDIKKKNTMYIVLKNILLKGLNIKVKRGATNHSRAAWTDLHIWSRNCKFETNYNPTYPTEEP
jgi:hypothetical protein